MWPLEWMVRFDISPLTNMFWSLGFVLRDVLIWPFSCCTERMFVVCVSVLVSGCSCVCFLGSCLGRNESSFWVMSI